MPRLVLQTAMISAFEFCKKKAIPIQFAAKVPRLGTIGKNHIQSRFNLSEESVLFFCSESDTFLRNYIISTKLSFRPNRLACTALAPSVRRH